MNTNIYYYFVKHLVGGIKIEKFATLMPFPKFELLTDEQVSFYLENPSASVAEVRKCKLNPPYIPPVPSIVQLQEEAKYHLKDVYMSKMGRYTDLQMTMAVTSHIALTTLTISDKCPYTLKEANDIIEGFNSLSKDAKDIYDHYFDLLGNQMTKEDIDNTLNAGLAELEVL